MRRTRYDEACFLILSCVPGVIVAAWLAPKDEYFMANFLFHWASQLVSLIVLGLVMIRLIETRLVITALSAAALVLALHLALFGAWLFSRSHPESIAWIGYLFSLPGALIGAIAGALVVRSQRHENAAKVGMVSSLFAASGVAMSQMVVCSTMMHCGA